MREITTTTTSNESLLMLTKLFKPKYVFLQVSACTQHLKWNLFVIKTKYILKSCTLLAIKLVKIKLQRRHKLTSSLYKISCIFIKCCMRVFCSNY